MDPQFIWRIDLGQVVIATVFTVLLPMAWRIGAEASKVRRELEEGLGEVRTLLREFPPHRHIGLRLIYPKGYRPDGDDGEQNPD